VTSLTLGLGPAIQDKLAETSRRHEMNDYTIHRGLADYGNRLAFEPQLATVSGDGPVRLTKPLFDMQVVPVEKSRFYQDVMGLPRFGLWIDVGAGTAKAQREYRRAGGKARLVAFGLRKPNAERDAKALEAHLSRDGQSVSVAFDPRADQPLAEFERQEGGRFAYVQGRPIEERHARLLSRQLGRADVITDVFGAFSYTLRLPDLLRTYGTLLKGGGRIYLGIDLTSVEIRDVSGKTIELARWLGSIPGLRLVRVYPLENEWSPNLAGVVLEREAHKALNVPRLKLADIGRQDAPPPIRTYDVVP
jgi:hypothetical protein